MWKRQDRNIISGQKDVLIIGYTLVKEEDYLFQTE